MADFHYSIAGLLVGLLVGATGIGGGALMTPLLILLFGVNPAVAIGTDLLFAALTKVAGVTVLGVRGGVDWPIVRRLLAGSLPAAFMTTTLVYLIGRTGHDVEHLLKMAVGVMLVVTAVIMFATPHMVAASDVGPIGRSPSRRRYEIPLTALAGMLIGVIVASTSIGAGALGTMILVFLYPRRLSPQRLVGTDLAHAIPLAAVAGGGYWVTGSLDFGLLAWLLAGSVPGVVLGALFASRAPAKLLRPLLAAVLFISGLNLVGRA